MSAAYEVEGQPLPPPAPRRRKSRAIHPYTPKSMNLTPLAISPVRVHERAERMVRLVCEAQEGGEKEAGAKMLATYVAYRRLYYSETASQAVDNAKWAIYAHRQARKEWRKTTGREPDF